MAKTQKQKLYDDLNTLIERYPNMRVSQMILTMQAWMNGVYHALPSARKGKPALIRDRRHTYRMG